MLLNEILGIKYPIIQGAMANIATPEFAAAVSNAGGLGIIATATMDENQVREAIKKCKSLTDKPFGVNIMLMNPKSAQIVDVICEEKVALVTTGAGSPGVYVEKLKAAGVKVFPVVASVALAQRLARLGIDGVIAEGTESGGHVGEATTMALLPQIVKALDIPVIAAGGIANGQAINACLAYGVIGFQVGTCLLVSKECPIHQNYKDAVLKAKDSSTTVTGRSAGAPVRILKNKMARQYLELERTNASTEEMEKLTLGGLRRAVFDGDVDMGSVMMGQIAGLCNEELTIAEIFERMIKEAKEGKAQLDSLIDAL